MLFFKGTFLGLCNLITGVNDFEELLSLSNEGDDRKIDLFVKDIYSGAETPHIDLDSSSLAISLGKLKEDNVDFKYIFNFLFIFFFHPPCFFKKLTKNQKFFKESRHNIEFTTYDCLQHWSGFLFGR